MGKFVAIMPNIGASGSVNGYFTDASRYYNTTYYPRYTYDYDVNKAWRNNAEQTAWHRTNFGKPHIPKKFTMSTPVDAVATKKTPTKFRIYGVKPDYYNIHRDWLLPDNAGVPATINWDGCDLLLEVDEGAGFWTPNTTKEWIINPKNKEYRAMVIYMWGKEEAWTGSPEYHISEMQYYEYVAEKDRALIKRGIDGEYISVEKHLIQPYGGMDFLDRNQERIGFANFRGSKNVRLPFSYKDKMPYGNAYLYATSMYVVSEHEFYKGKWYMEFSTNKANTYHMIGWHSKWELEYITTTWYDYDGVYFYNINGEIHGAVQRTYDEAWTRNSSGVERIGIAVDLDNNTFEVLYDGVTQSVVKFRELAKPLVPVISSVDGTEAGEIWVFTEPKHMPKGYKNVFGKREYEDVIVRLGASVTEEDFKKYGIKQGESIEFDKPYNKERVFESKVSMGTGGLYTFQIVPTNETINKLRIEV